MVYVFVSAYVCICMSSYELLSFEYVDRFSLNSMKSTPADDTQFHAFVISYSRSEQHGGSANLWDKGDVSAT
jgi:hypothetical protein